MLIALPISSATCPEAYDFKVSCGSPRCLLLSVFSQGFCVLQVFIKSELKVGVIYVKEDQYTEEEILDNSENSPLFEEFLQILGDKVRLKGESSSHRNITR